MDSRVQQNHRRRHRGRRKQQHRTLHFIRQNRGPLLRWCLLLAALGMLVLGCVRLVRHFHARRVQERAALEQQGMDLTWEKVRSVSPAGAYRASNFVRNGDFMTYADDRYVSLQGIDVSSYSGSIDWSQIEQAGIQFAVIRIGYRGYTEGGIHADSRYQENEAGCREQGLPYGVYFFSQAINEEEAREEANYCVEQLKNSSVSLPVFYDPEDAPNEEARTSSLTGEQITKNALAFAEVIRQAGYEPGLYVNKEWQEKVVDMSRFGDITVWFAGFTSTPQSQYHFEFWQYEYQGQVPGMGENIWADLDIQLVPVS